MRFLVLLLALFAIGFAQKHVDTAIIQVADQVDLTSEHFFVSVDYIEDELDEAGKVLAERDIKVAIRFDVDEQKQVLVNGVPATIGYSQLQIAAQIVEVQTTGQHVALPQLYSVSLRLFIGFAENNGVTEVLIQERVIGIESSEVWQADVLEQVLIIRTDGSVERKEAVQVAFLRGEPQQHNGHKGEHKGEHKHGEGKQGHHGKKPVDAVSDEQPQQEQPEEQQPKKTCWVKKSFQTALNWFHNLPLYLRVLVSFTGGIVFGLLGIGLIKCLACICRGKKRQVADAQAENYKANLRIYSLQYTSLPQDEKDAKKAEKEGSIEMA